MEFEMQALLLKKEAGKERRRAEVFFYHFSFK